MLHILLKFVTILELLGLQMSRSHRFPWAVDVPGPCPHMTFAPQCFDEALRIANRLLRRFRQAESVPETAAPRLLLWRGLGPGARTEIQVATQAGTLHRCKYTLRILLIFSFSLLMSWLLRNIMMALKPWKLKLRPPSEMPTWLELQDLYATAAIVHWLLRGLD